jgi:hypothetical protein
MSNISRESVEYYKNLLLEFGPTASRMRRARQLGGQLFKGTKKNKGKIVAGGAVGAVAAGGYALSTGTDTAPDGTDTAPVSKKSKNYSTTTRYIEKRTKPSAASEYGRMARYGVGMNEPRSEDDLRRRDAAIADIQAEYAEDPDSYHTYKPNAEHMTGRVRRGYSGTLGSSLVGDEKYGEYAHHLYADPDALKKELAQKRINEPTYTDIPSQTSSETDLDIVRNEFDDSNMTDMEAKEARLAAARRIMDEIVRKRKKTQPASYYTAGGSPI